MNPGEYEVTMIDSDLILYHVTCGQQMRPRIPVTIVEFIRLAKYHETEGTCTEKKKSA